MSRSSTREKAYKGGEDLEPLRIENNATLEMSVDAKDIREDNYFGFEDKNSKHIVIKGFKAGKWSLNENQSHDTYNIKIDGKTITFTKF
jgi:hypothetical protein